MIRPLADLTARLLTYTQPPPAPPLPVAQPVPDPAVEALHLRIAWLVREREQVLQTARRADRRRVEAEEQLAALWIAAAGTSTDRLALAHQTNQVYENRLALYEGRPSPITCPRACCAPAPTGAPA